MRFSSVLADLAMWLWIGLLRKEAEWDAPETNRFPADDDSTLSQKIFDVTVAQIESIVERDCVGNDIWRKSVAFVYYYNAQSARTLENLVAGTVVHTRSGMNGYELCDHLSEHFFRAIGGYFPNFSSSVGSISEEIYSRQAVCLSYTLLPALRKHTILVGAEAGGANVIAASKRAREESSLVTDDVPILNAAAPVSAYEDAEQMLRIVEAAQPDFGRFSPEEQIIAEQFSVNLQAIVAAGSEAYDAAATGTMLGGSAFLVATLRTLECDPFLAED